MTDSSRTILDFSFDGELNPILEKWAAANSFVTRDGVEGVIEYQRGGGVITCPIWLQIKQSGSNIHLETWLQVDILTGLLTLFNVPAQSAINSDAILLLREREFARLYVNKLLKDLGQPPIL